MSFSCSTCFVSTGQLTTFKLSCINMITGILGIVYWQSATKNAGVLPSSADTGLKVATSVVTVIGQLGFGWLADVAGRKRMYGLQLIIIIFATLGQSLSASAVSIDVVGLLIFWRVIMGIGIRGDYPLSSIITSELVSPAVGL